MEAASGLGSVCVSYVFKSLGKYKPVTETEFKEDSHSLNRTAVTALGTGSRGEIYKGSRPAKRSNSIEAYVIIL